MNPRLFGAYLSQIKSAVTRTTEPTAAEDAAATDKVMDSLSKQKMPETPMPVGAAGLGSMVGLFGPAALGGLGGALPGNSGMVPGTVRGMTAGVGGNLGHMLGGKASEALEHAGIQSPALRALLPILGYGGGAYAGYRAGKALTKTDKEKAQEKSANSQFETLKAPKVDISGLKNWNQLDPTAYSDDSGNAGWHLNMAKSASMEKDAFLGLIGKALPAAAGWVGKGLANMWRSGKSLAGGVVKVLGKEGAPIASKATPVAGAVRSATPWASGGHSAYNVTPAADTLRNKLFNWGSKARDSAVRGTQTANSAFQTKHVAPMMNAFGKLPQWQQTGLRGAGTLGRVAGGYYGLAGGPAASVGTRLGFQKSQEQGAQQAVGAGADMLEGLANKADESWLNRIMMGKEMSDPETLRALVKQLRDPNFVRTMSGR